MYKVSFFQVDFTLKLKWRTVSIKLSLFANSIIVYVENSMKSTKKLLELISLIKTEYEINIQKSTIFYIYIGIKSRNWYYNKVMYNVIENIKQEEFWQEWTLAHWKVQIVLRKIKDDLYNLKRYTVNGSKDQ